MDNAVRIATLADKLLIQGNLRNIYNLFEDCFGTKVLTEEQCSIINGMMTELRVKLYLPLVEENKKEMSAIAEAASYHHRN